MNCMQSFPQVAANPFGTTRRKLAYRSQMELRFDDSWIAAEAARTAERWNSCVNLPMPPAPLYGAAEHARRESAFDRSLAVVEREIKRAPRNKTGRLAMQDRLVSSFGSFAAAALDLRDEAIHLITNEFLPAGTQLARWARRFDPSLSRPDIVQACRNAWTACGLQPLLGEPIGITPSILGYSLLYPYTDNYLDRPEVSADAKLQFSARFRQRLRGAEIEPLNRRETALWALVELIEGQFPRELFPQVFDSLLAIHGAQEASIAQLRRDALVDHAEVLRISCAKGGSSVLADACLARGWLREEEARFSFAWGVLLQLGDDLQDLREDLERGSATIFSRAASQSKPLDAAAIQLLNMSESVVAEMAGLPNASKMLKNLLQMSWRSLIIGAVANAPAFFSPGFLTEAEARSPFRFAFLRERQKKLASRAGLYEAMFSAFIESQEESDSSPSLAKCELPATSAMASA